MAMEQPLIDKNSRFYTSYSKKSRIFAPNL